MTFPKPVGFSPLVVYGDLITERIRSTPLAEAQAAWRDKIPSMVGATDEWIAKVHSGEARLEGNTKDGLWYASGPDCSSD